MNTRARALDLANERNTEKRYAKVLREAAVRIPRPQFFAGTRVPKLADRPLGELVGRVALSGPNHELLNGDTDFYIGEKHAVVDGKEVYSWAAPIACSFFQQNHSHDCYPEVGRLCVEVAVTRTFIRYNGQIHDFADDVVGKEVPTEPFTRRALKVPKAPPLARGLTRLPSAPNTVPTAGMDSDPEGQNGPALRAASALRAQLRAPRSKCLLSVLATLQPDQYELVTKPAMESFIVEGQPGTGKTIIAAHRAAYLVHAETPPENSLDGRILLIGPTSGYTNHVRSAVTQLSARSDRIKVLSLPELMNVIVRRRELPPNSASPASWQDGDWRLGRFARAAIAALSESGDRSPSAEDVYDYLRHNGSQARPITRKADWAQYLRRLPPFTAAVSDRVHLPLIAFIQWELDAPASLRGVELIIVDEAQDVSELEWHLLQQINAADAWTIFGDLNQRQAGHLQFDWAKLLDILALDEQTTIRTLSNGYRSTRPILDFANRLLPTGERTAIAIQREGPEPLLDAAEPKRLGAKVLRHIERLLITHPKGTVAVIGPDLSVVRNSLRKARWRAVNESLHVWERDDREITVVDPATARGVEFDAVIVVEPADFERDLTKRGTLYTALTRPNRELVVVHTKPLPLELRVR